MSDSFRFSIQICQSTNPKLKGYGCCMEKGGEEIFNQMKDLLEEEGLVYQVKLKSVNCLRNCHQGVSIRIIPGPVHYGNVSKEDVIRIVREHLLNGEIVSEIQVPFSRGFF